jgi:hypothetical protein
MLTMGWFHCHKRRGALLALAALAVQIALSFGHFHLDGVRTAPHGVVAGAHNIAVAQTSERLPPQNPADNDDYCAICASIFLASTAFAAQPPQLPVPLHFARIVPAFAAEQSASLSRPVFFRSRAPPAA